MTDKQIDKQLDGRKINHQIDSKPKLRRDVLKRVAAGGATATIAATMPKEWLKPIVDTVILPAHAVCSDGCDVSLSITDRDVPERACSGGLHLYPLDFIGTVSPGCADITIISVSASLPGAATYTLSVSAGDTLTAGDTFSLRVENYQGGAVLCTPEEAGSVTITYNCVDFVGADQTFEIDIVAEVLAGQT